MKALVARIREPSSLAAVAVLLGVFGVKVAPESLASVIDGATVITGALAFLMPERGQ